LVSFAFNVSISLYIVNAQKSAERFAILKSAKSNYLAQPLLINPLNLQLS